METGNRIFDSDYKSMLNKDYWDYRAKDYNESASKRIEPDREKEELIQSFFDQGILTSRSRVLDLGCGPGWFTCELAKRVGEVVGIDISDEMLRYARDNTRQFGNVSLLNLDWSQADIAFLGAFDLVFANMAPAIYDDITLNKMISASRGYCYYSHFAGRSSNIGDDLDKLLGVIKEFKRIPNMFCSLWEMGYYPVVGYADKFGESAIPLEDAMIYYQKEYGFTQEHSQRVRGILQRHMEGGMVRRVSAFKKGFLLWKVRRI